MLQIKTSNKRGAILYTIDDIQCVLLVINGLKAHIAHERYEAVHAAERMRKRREKIYRNASWHVRLDSKRQSVILDELFGPGTSTSDTASRIW